MLASPPSLSPPLQAAEFFAGIGLFRKAMEQSGITVKFANDISPLKQKVYVSNFGTPEFVLGDIAHLVPAQIPDIDLATASFPCTDLSLAGNQAGIHAQHSGTFWLFADLLGTLRARRPPVVLLENVAGLGTSHQGEALAQIISRLNHLGYFCDIVQIDAMHWVPQSRSRLFVIGTVKLPPTATTWQADSIIPAWIGTVLHSHPALATYATPLPPPPVSSVALQSCLEFLSPDDKRWWDAARIDQFVTSLSPPQATRLQNLRNSPTSVWRTAYRRTRNGIVRWEIRADAISGCLRTSSGGSSRQALVEIQAGQIRIRWMTAAEYAALMGAGDYKIDMVSENQAIFCFGDAVCVQAVRWLLDNYIVPLTTQLKTDHPIIN